MARLLDFNEKSVEVAAEFLSRGGLVAFPTETVYGLGGSAYNRSTVEQIYRIKNRPSQNPLISHFAEISDVWCDVIPTSNAQKLAEAFWPGPMTLVLNKRSDSKISDLACASLPTAAVRVPSNNVAQQLIKHCGMPIVAPSANKSTGLSATTAEMVMHHFIDDDLLVIDGGQCLVGIESTIIDARCEEYVTVLRHGVITNNDISDVCVIRQSENKQKPIAPGMMYKHYSPKNHRVLINSEICHSDDAYLDFGHKHNVHSKYYMNLSESGDLHEAASNLFTMLYELDKTDCNNIVIAPIPNAGVGVAINDKLIRASGFVGVQ